MVIQWKTITPESKIYISPYQIVLKHGIDIGTIAKYLCLIFVLNIWQVVFEIQDAKQLPPLG
jgi:hypothetical protein